MDHWHWTLTLVCFATLIQSGKEKNDFLDVEFIFNMLIFIQYVNIIIIGAVTEAKVAKIKNRK